jgi:hypothetical protein
VINYFDLANAYTKYRELTNAPANSNTVRRFWQFLGIDEGTKFNDKVDNDEAVNRIKWLTGPNAYTLYKAWEARQENSK